MSNSATIIDFSAYRTNKRGSAQPAHDQICLSARVGALLALSWFWPVLAWMPLASFDLAARQEDHS